MPKVRLLCVVLASLFVVVAPGSVIAAPPLFQAHDSFTETFPDAVCGIEGTSVVKGVDNFQLSANNTFRDDFTLDQTFTATDSQKSIVIHVGENFTGTDEEQLAVRPSRQRSHPPQKTWNGTLTRSPGLTPRSTTVTGR